MNNLNCNLIVSLSLVNSNPCRDELAPSNLRVSSWQVAVPRYPRTQTINLIAYQRRTLA